MSAADLPEAGHPSPDAMARCLSGYIACPLTVRRAVLAEFGCSPSPSTIRWYRYQALERRNRPQLPPFKPHEGFDPSFAAERAERASRIFLERLAHERRTMVEGAACRV